MLRVPVDSFDTARKALSRLGKVTSSSESEKDVTTQVIDTAERVQTLQNSLDRLQRFQRSAKDVDDLIQFENQITSRQAELQSLKAQQSYLSSQSSMSTITLTLSQPGKEPPGTLDDAGFLAGLRAGWQALASAFVVALTVAGAVLPFLVVLALLGVPLFYFVGLLRAVEESLLHPTRAETREGVTPRHHSECTWSVSRASWSGSVDGSTPWPRLKT